MSLVLFATFATLGLLGCGGALAHDFSAAQASDYRLAPRPTDDQGEEPVVLVPANTRLTAARVGPGGIYICKECAADGALGSARERYQGPARVFLWPGAHHYVLSVTTAGGVVELELDLLLEPRQRFRLEIGESSDKVDVSVVALSEDSYRALYPAGR